MSRAFRWVKHNSNAVVALAVLISGGTAWGIPIVPDAYTVVLDRFEGNSTGQLVKKLNYSPSLTGYGQAGVFGELSYVRYALPASSTWDQLQGTIELWLKPQTHDFYLDFNWNNVTTAPPAGHVLGLWDGTISGHLELGNWNFQYNLMLDSQQTTQLGVWSHLAATWGPAGSKLYLNGHVIASTPTNLYPASGAFAYLNGWGTTGFVGMVDEFHLSRIQRSDAEIAQHAARPASAATLWANNGHWYRAVQTSFAGKLEVRWNQANQAAIAAGGYLASITSAEENAFLFDLIHDSNLWPGNSGLWLGAIQPDGSAEPASGWEWLSAEAWAYTAWAAGQPDNGGDENRLVFRTSTGLWNDLNNDKYLAGFVVEFDSPPVIESPAISTFETDPEGWITGGDAKLPTYQAPDATHRGCIYMDDRTEGLGSAFLAPAQFLGSKRGAYGGAISFDIRSVNIDNRAGEWDLLVSGAGKTLFIDLPEPQNGVWKHQVALLTESAGWRVNDPRGPEATPSELLEVLDDLTGLAINTEFHDGADRTYLDNVVMSLPNDFDRDGDVDGDDLTIMQRCVQGPAIPTTAECAAEDLDHDGDVDQSDFGLFQQCLSGKDRPASMDCAG